MAEDTDLPSPNSVLGLGEDNVEPSPKEKRRASRRKPKIIEGKDGRTRKEELVIIVDNILKTMNDDIDARDSWMDMRTERYAKLRGWRGDKDYPWPDSANVHIPVMQIDNLRTQDTLHNAVLAIRPVINAKSTKRADQPKEEIIDDLIDYQVFVDQEGEEALSLLIQKFVEDGRFTAYIPWVRDTQNIHDVKILDSLEEDDNEQEAFRALVESGSIIPNIIDAEQVDEDGFEWEVNFKDEDGKRRKGKINFYFRDNDQIEAHIAMPKQLFNGPVIIPKSIEDVVAPWRCGNLQPPSPSNPYGASHVRLVEFPSLDEILKLKEDGYYDELTDDDVELLKSDSSIKPDITNDEDMREQKDIFEGIEAGVSIDGKKVFKRIVAFDRYDVNGDGLDEDVMFWIIESPKIMLRARMLTEMFPTTPPRRPLAEAQLMPTGEDRLYGISMPELMEPLQDIIVTTVNQVIDNNTIANTPFFFFRPGTGMRSDTIRLAPGEGYPLNNPTQDAHFPPIQGKAQTEGFNLMTISQQYSDKLTLVSDINRGQIPKGGSSALRTAGATSAILQQGEARPERVLRRLFMGIQQIYETIHTLNQRFLPTNKQIRIGGFVDDDKDPYREIANINEIRAEMNFEFQASLTNTSPGAIEQSLNKIAALVFSPISQAIGTADPEGMYRLQRDMIKINKIDPDRYIKRPPNVDLDALKLTAEEVITEIFTDNKLPNSIPLESTQVHMNKLLEFIQGDQLGFFNETHLQFLNQHMSGIQQRLQQEQEQLKRVKAAAESQKGEGGQGLPRGGPTPDIGPGGNPPINSGELLDESLPGAGGGANNNA